MNINTEGLRLDNWSLAIALGMDKPRESKKRLQKKISNLQQYHSSNQTPKELAGK
jgi:hypothetical protein